MTENYTFPCGCSFPILEESDDPEVMPLLGFDYYKIPDSCFATWALLASGLTKGVFQLEKNLGKKWSKRLKPESIDDVAALVALLRPGCLMSEDERGVNMTENYCRRKNHEEEPENVHPIYDQITEPTHNIMCYQEQLMRCGKELAGFNLIEVDKLRKGVGKKDQKELAKVRDMFLAGCEKTKVIGDEQAKVIWNWIEKSGRYLFNKAHAVSYGRESYDTAYIKAHFPLGFFSGWLRGSLDKQKPQEEVAELIEDAKLFDIVVLPPDIRTEEAWFQTEQKKFIRVGLANVKGIGEKQVLKLADVAAELAHTVGKDLQDCTWLEFLMFGSGHLTSTTVRGWIESGAMDHFGLQRKRMLEEFRVWSELKDKEKEWAQNLELYRRGRLAIDVFCPPPTPKQLEELLGVELTEAETTKLQKKVDQANAKDRARWEALCELIRGRAAMIKESDFVSILTAISPLRSAGGGVSRGARTEAILSEVHFLENPPSPMVDSLNWKAWCEKDLIGASITCSRLDACDLSDVNVSCRDYLSGMTGYLVFGVEVKNVRVILTKKGKNPGQEMAFLTIADDTGSLSDVICFSDVWKEYRELLNEDELLILEGERDHKKGSNSLLVKRVFRAQ